MSIAEKGPRNQALMSDFSNLAWVGLTDVRVDVGWWAGGKGVSLGGQGLWI